MENKISKIIEKEFNAKVLEVKRITEGYSHYMYLVKIDKEPFEVIVRFSNNKKEDVGLSKEKYIIETLQKNNIPAPKIYAFSEEYMILEKLSGIRLDTIWDSLTKQEKIQITREMGKLLARIHSIKLEKFGKIENEGKIKSDEAFNFRDMGERISYNKFLRQWLVDHFEDFARMAAYKHISNEFLMKFFAFLINNKDKLEYNGEPVLIHGDYYPGHIFVEKVNNEYKITGIIDFEFSYSSSPEYDFIKLHRNGFFDDADLENALREGYGKINKEVVRIHRIARDFGFAWAVLEAGNKELSDKTLKEIEEKIK